ncbi:MAG: HAMP domain-containing protein [Thermoguttaceae bacterium]|nr:HAMP domain-containing protein [Thermoguttaceae bacterium]
MDGKRSPRSIFESSLEIKCLFFFGVALAIVILISVLLYYKATKSQVEAQNPLMGKLLSEREFLLMHIKGLTSEKSKTGDANDADLNDFIDSMASLSEEIGGQTERARFETRLIRMRSGAAATESNDSGDFYDSPDGPRDEFERKLIDELAATASTGEDAGQNRAIERTDGDGRYHYYQPLRIDRSCWNCHREIMGDASIDLGAPLGVVQVTIPEPPANKERARLWTLLLGGAIVVAFLGLIAFYVVIRLAIVKPLRSLREVSEAIGRGDVSKRAELRTGDEFEALGAAFNQMMKYLVATHEKLRLLNSQLEKKVDELAQANWQLYEMNRVKSDFMATMSHELRTPLNSILGFSDVLSSIQTLDEKQKRYVNNINKSGRALLNMINNVLDLARVDAGRLQAQISEFRIEAVVLAQCDMAKPLVDKKNLELTTRFAENLPKMRQDEARIQQILNNLLSNAIKFTPEGGRIQVEIDRAFRAPLYPRAFGGGTNEPIPFLEMKVIDSGVGVALEDRQIIFEKFRQGKSATEGNMMTREYSGSGLGLSIVKELCKLLEGEVTLESQPGFGSVFIVSLPWELNASVLTESPIKAEIDSFAKAGVGRKTGTLSLEEK